MTQINQASLDNLLTLQDVIGEQARKCNTLEAAAQKYMTILYENLHESIVLTRLFVTIPFGELPEPNRKFVIQLAKSKNVEDQLNEHTLVLSLLGTKGVKQEWSDRHLSQGHVGIPLSSSAFIEQVPMLARLLKQLCLNLDWIDSNDTNLVKKTVGNISGVFYVRDAVSEVDSRGRKIIAAQDFVREQNIKTVFGLGGGYLGSSTMFTAIIFTRQYLELETIERFMTQANKFKTATMAMVDQGKIFA